MKTLYTAVATATGGRTGHVESSDKIVDFHLAVPSEMGGDGHAGTNPEQLFASGYAACFGSALDYLAQQRKITTGDVRVTAKVSIGPNDTLGFGLAAELDVFVPALDQEQAEALVAEAHAVCPYSNATKGSMEVTLVTHGGSQAQAE